MRGGKVFIGRAAEIIQRSRAKISRLCVSSDTRKVGLHKHPGLNPLKTSTSSFFVFTPYRFTMFGGCLNLIVFYSLSFPGSNAISGHS